MTDGPSSSRARISVGYRSSADSGRKPGIPNDSRVVDEVRVAELDRERPPELVALLPVDQPVAVVAPDDHDDRGADALRGLELLGVHEEAAVAAQRDDLAVGVDELCRDRARQRDAHRREAVGDDTVFGS